VKSGGEGRHEAPIPRRIDFFNADASTPADLYADGVLLRPEDAYNLDQLAIELYCDESLTLRVKVCHRLGDIKDRSLQRLCWL
jgi:hypothetical protein